MFLSKNERLFDLKLHFLIKSNIKLTFPFLDLKLFDWCYLIQDFLHKHFLLVGHIHIRRFSHRALKSLHFDHDEWVRNRIRRGPRIPNLGKNFVQRKIIPNY